MTGPVLDVWLYGTRLATLSGPERPGLSWADEGIARWGAGSRVLSAKLPIGSSVVSALVRTYLDGLLPEGNARVNHAMAAGLSPDDSLGLMAVYGRDTPGAAIFVEHGHGDPTRSGHYEPLEPSEVAERLRTADRFSPAQFEGVIESSTLPGMVPKVTLHREGSGPWYSCKEGAASTWIVKRGAPPNTESADVIDTEVACLALARDLGLTDIQAEVLTFEDDRGPLRAIAVSRYDRVPAADPRLHQEDLAQATGLNTGDPNRKFQWGSRMPALGQAAEVLRLDGGDRDQLLRLVTFSYLAGNTDMHAKNISFLRLPDGRVRLAPAYDIAMHLHHAREGRRFALDVNGKYWVDGTGEQAVTITDLIAEGKSWGLPVARAQNLVEQTVDDLTAALGRIDPADHPGVSDEAWLTVHRRVSRAAGRLGPRSRSVTEEQLEKRPSRTRRRGPRAPK